MLYTADNILLSWWEAMNPNMNASSCLLLMVGYNASWYLGAKRNNTGSFVEPKCTSIPSSVLRGSLHLNYTSGAVQIKSSFLKDASAPLVPLTEITSLC